MKKLQVRSMRENLSKHPLHLILAAFTITAGTSLIFDDHYFFWPPGFKEIYNSDFVGTWALFTGLGLIYVAMHRYIPSRSNTIWLLSECGFLGAMAGLEISHGVVAHNDHMILFGVAYLSFLMITLLIIKQNNTNTDKINRRLKRRDEKMKG